jgi:hypothetical protein
MKELIIMKKLIEGTDFYYNEQGFIVLTELYHLNRGYCCGKGCRHCAYDYENVAETKRSELLGNRQLQETVN